MDQLKDHIKGKRHNYNKAQLTEGDLTETPFELFSQWFQMALDEGVHEPIAMNLATVDEAGRPSSRIVLMRGFDENGIEFFTNYHSRKGREIQAHPSVSINFYWYELHKQIRIDGTVKQLDAAMSDEYFNSRPRESQIGAWASAQSTILKNRQELDDRYASLENKFRDQPVPRPKHWGGYLVMPRLFEFWQGRPDRLHDRFQYLLEDNTWKVNRLAP